MARRWKRGNIVGENGDGRNVLALKKKNAPGTSQTTTWYTHRVQLCEERLWKRRLYRDKCNCEATIGVLEGTEAICLADLSRYFLLRQYSSS